MKKHFDRLIPFLIYLILFHAFWMVRVCVWNLPMHAIFRRYNPAIRTDKYSHTTAGVGAFCLSISALYLPRRPAGIPQAETKLAAWRSHRVGTLQPHFIRQPVALWFTPSGLIIINLEWLPQYLRADRVY